MTQAGVEVFTCIPWLPLCAFVQTSTSVRWYEPVSVECELTFPPLPSDPGPFTPVCTVGDSCNGAAESQFGAEASVRTFSGSLTSSDPLGTRVRAPMSLLLSRNNSHLTSECEVSCSIGGSVAPPLWLTVTSFAAPFFGNMLDERWVNHTGENISAVRHGRLTWPTTSGGEYFTFVGPDAANVNCKQGPYFPEGTYATVGGLNASVVSRSDNALTVKLPLFEDVSSSSLQAFTVAS